MDETGKKLLNLMFRPGETICVSNSVYGYQSIPLEEAFKEQVTLVPVDPQKPCEFVKSNLLTLVALNPILGARQDANCLAFRNFLVEVDYGTLAQQFAYIKQTELPYSAAVFSGNKSLHFLVSLSEDLENEKTWRTMAEWTLGIVTVADQMTKNPSRSIRIPGAIREPGKIQKLVDYRGATSIKEFGEWLMRHPSCRPKGKVKRPPREFGIGSMPIWVKTLLKYVLSESKGRNKQWFSISCEFALAGYSLDDTLDILNDYFEPDRDFKEREWKTAINSGFKYIYENRKSHDPR